MVVLEVIGWALLGGMAVAAFITPIYVVDRLFSKSDNAVIPRASSPTTPPPPYPKR